MAKKDIPNEVLEFIYENIKTYEELKILIFLFRNWHKDYLPKDIVYQMNINIDLINHSLNNLYLSNLILRTTRGLDFYYYYNPSNKNNEIINSVLNKIYDKKKIELLVLILSNPNIYRTKEDIVVMNLPQKLITKLINEYTNDDLSIDDFEFDKFFTGHIHDISDIHWTPIKVAIKASNLLTESSETKILDIGSGVGKFCVIGALTTNAHYTGVEYRKSLSEIAKKVVNKFNLKNVEILNSNIMDIDFYKFDSFYFYNSFFENIFNESFEDNIRIDNSVELSPELYKKYTEYLFNKLNELNSGTKIVTYCGLNKQIPKSYRLEYVDPVYDLKLWIKN
jgi:predicted transcriptional regulator